MPAHALRHAATTVLGSLQSEVCETPDNFGGSESLEASENFDSWEDLEILGNPEDLEVSESREAMETLDDPAKMVKRRRGLPRKRRSSGDYAESSPPMPPMTSDNHEASEIVLVRTQSDPPESRERPAEVSPLPTAELLEVAEKLKVFKPGIKKRRGRPLGSRNRFNIFDGYVKSSMPGTTSRSDRLRNRNRTALMEPPMLTTTDASDSFNETASKGSSNRTATDISGGRNKTASKEISLTSASKVLKSAKILRGPMPGIKKRRGRNSKQFQYI